MKYLLILFLLLSAFVHGDEPTDEAEAQDALIVKEGNTTLELRLVPQEIIKGKDLLSRALTTKKETEDTLSARVGELAFIVGDVKVDGEIVKNTEFELTFHHIEDAKDVFTVTVNSKNGVLNWGQQFFDGAMHRVTLKAKSPNGVFTPMMAVLNVDVEGIDPPSGVVMKSMALLLGTVLFGMIIGYLLSFKATSKKVMV
ncbi:MAG: hypothetical protein NE330_15580 [Lentisphaeraceae bacterium]|nr:hypothetical protein [Lentisphaeraceae bacterium]